MGFDILKRYVTLHVKCVKDDYLKFKSKLAIKELSVHEVFNEFVRLHALGDRRLEAVIESLYVRKLKESADKLYKKPYDKLGSLSEDALYSIINEENDDQQTG